MFFLPSSIRLAVFFYVVSALSAPRFAPNLDPGCRNAAGLVAVHRVAGPTQTCAVLSYPVVAVELAGAI